MSNDRKPFQMSLAFMLFLLIVGGPLVGVIVPRLVGIEYEELAPSSWGPSLVDCPKCGGLVYDIQPCPKCGKSPLEYAWVIEGCNSGCMRDESEPSWVADTPNPLQ
jgi:hypothetical protein